MTTAASVPDNDGGVLGAALGYARRGWFVFPVRGKVPALPKGTSWQAVATTDPKVIAGWFVGRGEGTIGIGVHLGPSGLAMVDGDHLDLMPTGLRVALGHCGTWTHRGQRDRLGWLFEVDPNDPPPQARHDWGEVKAAGGYVVLAPSRHPSGVLYEWVEQPGDAPVPLPPGLRRAVAPHQASKAPSETRAAWQGGTPTPTEVQAVRALLGRLAAGLASTPEGGRNNALNAAAMAAGHYVPHYLQEDEVRLALLRACHENGYIADKSNDAALDTIASGLGAGMASPQTADHLVVLEDPLDGLVDPDAPKAPTPPGGAGLSPEAAALLAGAPPGVQTAVHAMVEREAAKRLFAELQAIVEPERVPVEHGTLAAMLALPDPGVRYRVEGLLPTGGRLLVVAQRKTGKTTLVTHLAAALTGEGLFLGSLAVAPLGAGRRVVLLNYELGRGMFARWLDEAGVAHDRAYPVNLRGARNPFATERGRRWLVDLLVEVGAEVLVVDPFAVAFTGPDPNDNGTVRAWLTALDYVATQGGAEEVVLVHHAGWGAEGRSRGASALEDWPDTILSLTKDDESGIRHIVTMGRDVTALDEDLHFDPMMRSLSLAGGPTRAERKRQRDSEREEQKHAGWLPRLNDLMKHIEANPGRTRAELERAPLGLPRDAIRYLLDEAIRRGWVRVEVTPGTGRKGHHAEPWTASRVLQP